MNDISFGHLLLDWHERTHRPLPWKETDDPYRIWLSEIILQQTQVKQGIPYYHKFTARYPTVFDLAAASEDEVLKDWQGLGYNSRARNLRKAAQTVAEDHHGYFPKDYQGLLTLPGIGPYTAAAISSFAYGERVPVIDVNVIRVMCRYLGVYDLPAGKAVRARLEDFLIRELKQHDPAEFNQAIMNFGALQCKPRKPVCHDCPLNDSCIAYKAGDADNLPIKAPRKKRRNRYFNYIVVDHGDDTVLKKRLSKDIWQGMYDFPLVEKESPEVIRAMEVEQELEALTGLVGKHVSTSELSHQILTHQKIHCRFYHCELVQAPKTELPHPYAIIGYRELSNFAVPKVIDCYFSAK